MQLPAFLAAEPPARASLSALATQLLPLYRIDLDFRFLHDAFPGLLHQPALTGLIRSLMPGPANDEPAFWVEAPESGRACYTAGDAYRLQLWALPTGVAALQALIERLRRLPHSLGEADARLSFGPNLLCRGAFQPHTDIRGSGFTPSPVYDASDFELERAFWQRQSHVRLRLQSPVRLLRPKQHRSDAKGEARYVRRIDEWTVGLLEQRLWDTLRHLAGPAYDRLWPPWTSGAQETGGDAFWIDWNYRDADSTEHAMGGMLGYVDLDLRHASPEFIAVLVLGQRLGLGQRRSFGWGRYRLETLDGRGTAPPRQRKPGLLHRAATSALLRGALLDSLERAAPAAYRDTSIGELRRGGALPELLREDLLALQESLTSGRHVAPALCGRVLEQNGKLRPLAVPPWRDRVAQRAVATVLTPELDTLFNASSYGYRRGRSRQDARDRILALRRAGYRYAFEADIDGFFDAIERTRLHTRLQGLLGDDPGLSLLLDWMAAPVVFAGRTVARPNGIPQGSPLSPLMANVMLEDFDADIEAAGFRLVRYADDFVVVCRRRADAEQAWQAAAESLGDIGLQLKAAKTGIVDLDQGMDFLGFRFVGDRAIDHPRLPRQQQPRREAVPAGSWLDLLLQREPALWHQVLASTRSDTRPSDEDLRLVAVLGPTSRMRLRGDIEGPGAENSNAGDAETDSTPFSPHATPAFESQASGPPRATAGEPAAAIQQSPDETPAPPIATGAEYPAAGDGLDDDDLPLLPNAETAGGPLDAGQASETEGQWLYLLEPTALLAQRKGRLQVSRENLGVREFAWPDLESIVLVGRHRISSGAIQQALRHDVPVHFADHRGHYLGRLVAEHGSDDAHALLLAQASQWQDPAERLRLAGPLIQARLHNQRDTLRQRARRHAAMAHAGADIARLAEQATAAQDLAQLRGYEGAATRCYYAALALHLPDGFTFNGRNRRPPRDPVNALLSLGYTVLYTHAITLLHSLGLQPRIGFLHESRGRHAALASDLIEPLRHLVERLVWAMLHRRQLRPEDFDVDPSDGCRVQPAARRRYLAELSLVLDRPVANTDAESLSPLAALRRQGLRLRARLRGSDEAPWFLHCR